MFLSHDNQHAQVVDSKAYNSYQYGLGVQHSSVSEELRALMSFVREEAERRQAADVELHRLLTCKGDTIPGECYAQLEKDKNELQMRLKKSQDELTVLVAKVSLVAFLHCAGVHLIYHDRR